MEFTFHRENPKEVNSILATLKWVIFLLPGCQLLFTYLEEGLSDVKEGSVTFWMLLWAGSNKG